MRYRFFILVGLVFWCANTGFSLPDRYTSIVVEAKTGRILESHKPDCVRYPASMAKMMTLYLAFEALEKGIITPNTKFKVSRRAARQEPCKLGLKPGQKISVSRIIEGAIVKSANDATVAFAEGMHGTEAAFAIAMTRKARALGMKRTVFKNSSGLPNRAQVTTARDMAILARALFFRFPKYFQNFSKTHIPFRGKKYQNHNKLLGRLKEDRSIIVDGIKTGYIRAIGNNLTTSATQGNNRLFVVVIGGKNYKWRDARIKRLLRRNFAKLKRLKNTNQLTFVGGFRYDSSGRNILIPQSRPSSFKVEHLSLKQVHAAVHPSLDDVFVRICQPSRPEGRLRPMPRPACLQQLSLNSFPKSGISKPKAVLTPISLPPQRPSLTPTWVPLFFKEAKRIVRPLKLVKRAGLIQALYAGETATTTPKTIKLKTPLKQWSVDIGDFKSKQILQNHTKRIVDQFGGDALFSEKRAASSPRYHARIQQLTKEDARRVCQLAELESYSCLTLRT